MLANWIQLLRPLLKGGWYWGLDGKIRMKREGEAVDSPWLHAPVSIEGIHEAGLDCGLVTIFHNHVCGKRGVHSFCMECYKVVIVPESLEQVHKIADWQQLECADNGWACKVGAERRNYTQRAWGAYFYCRGVEEGRERYKVVRKWVDENLGEDVVVFLKRACTEFEQNMGDSDKWELLPHQEEIEKEFLEVVGYEPALVGQSGPVQHHVYDLWDQWDADNQSYVTYHEEGE